MASIRSRSFGWLVARCLVLAGALDGGMTLAGLPATGLPTGGLTTAAGQAAVEGSSLDAKAWSDRVWAAARDDRSDELFSLLEAVPEDVDSARVTGLRDSISSFLANREQQDARRQELIEKAWGDLREARASDKPAPQALSEALAEAVELSALMPGSKSLLENEEIKSLISEAEAEAMRAEHDREWLNASELYARLSMLFDDGLSYRQELRTLGRRQAIISLYAPETFYNLRNEHRVSRGLDELPPYNPRGEHYSEKLTGISDLMILQAINRANREHIDPESNGLADLFASGLRGVRTFAATTELGETFPEMNDTEAVGMFLADLDRMIEMVSAPGYRATYPALDAILKRVSNAANRRLGVPEEAVLHEFGVGAMASLDDFTDIIWPHDVKQFERQTRGRFVGVGIQIRLDEVSNIKVVTPLAGTPAQRAGIRAGDVIRKVDGDSTEGFSLDQAVQNITGPEGTEVVLTIEREIEDDEGEAQFVTEDLTITRSEIDLPTIKGWTKNSPAEDDWNWFIDETNGIGVIRMSGFSDKTSRRLDRAIRQLKEDGARGLILDLRFNPGGLLTQAVEVSNRFVPEGDIVSTVDARRTVTQRERANPAKASLAEIPTIVLVNENSASASEIVSGAIQHYADAGDIDAMVLGQRSFGKGSVQNVYPLGRGAGAYIKLTTQYYRLPSGRILHRTPGAEMWGVEPDYHADLLPEQIAEMLGIRQNADVIPLDEFGEPIADLAPDDPQKLLDEGIDLQLQTALVLLQAKVFNPDTSFPVDKAVLKD